MELNGNQNRRAIYYAFLLNTTSLSAAVVHISLSAYKMFQFSAAKLLPLTFITFLHSFPLSVQNLTTALYCTFSLVGSGIPVYIN